MLDQNTDRMWYVIGAVIVGAAIIFLVNSSFPQLFASVVVIFENKVTEVSGVIEPNKNLIGPNDVKVTSKIKEWSYNSMADEWTITIPTAIKTGGEIWDDGLVIKDNVLEVPFGESFSLSYEIYVAEGAGQLTSIPDINNALVVGESWSINDNDVVGQRLHNGILWSDAGYNGSVKTIPNGQWTKVWYGYTNIDKRNVNKVPLKDFTRFGAVNETVNPVTIKIRNIKGEHSRYPTEYVDKEEVK